MCAPEFQVVLSSLGSPYPGFNVLAAESWRGVWRLADRIPDDVLTEVRAALLASPGEGELRGATASALTCYLMLRRRLASSLQKCSPLCARHAFNRSRRELTDARAPATRSD